MHMARPMQILIASLLSTTCYALPISNVDADAFVKAYSFDMLQVLADETLSEKVDSGELTREQAECAKTTIRWNDVRTPARAIVADTFPDSRTVRQATKFLHSPTGMKWKEFGVATLKDMLKAKASGQQPAPAGAIPPSFTDKDFPVSANFFFSVAGQLFTRFVTEGFPKLRQVDLLEVDAAIASCKAQ